MEEFKYIMVLFTSDRKIEPEIDSATSTVMWTLHRSVVVKRELSQKVLDLLVYLHSYLHGLWVVTERTSWRVQAAEISFFFRVGWALS